jgi:hypothetical protein
MEPSFYIPYGDGMALPMAIVSFESTQIGSGPFELTSVEMAFRAVSCGAPVSSTTVPVMAQLSRVED